VIRLFFSGRHNLLNADATITVAKQLGIPKDAIKMLCGFKGVARRMELIGTTADNVAIYSDYGHHQQQSRLP
jgi:UDP-N-acetylmuramate--alanine ligase